MMPYLMVAGLLVLTVAGAGPQPPVPPAQASGRPAGAPADTADSIPPPVLAEMLDTYAIFQAQQALSITDDKYGPFTARLKRLQDLRRRNMRLRHQMIRQLAQLVGPKAPMPPDEAAIRARLTALREHDDRAAAELRHAYDALDELLDARQQARFRLFEEQIEQRKLDLLVRARERANRPVKR